MDNDATLVQDPSELKRTAELSRSAEGPPAVIPGYTMIRSLGEGAFGSVWLASEENTGKQVAIKFYSHQQGLDWSLLNREVEKLALLYTSRNIVRLIDVGWNSEPPYYVMEYLANGSLASLLASGPLPSSEAVRIAKSVLHALVHAHGRGILHCDLKPANVLMDNDLEPRLCDFGQSRLSTEQNPALGTLFYMAPEQADLQAVPDARWDVYALGALLYHMLCGEPPFRTPQTEAQIRSAPNIEARLAIYREKIRTSPKPLGLRNRPGIDRRLADIVERCLQVDPQKRLPNAQAVLDLLLLRDRARARRPLITLGIVGPSLLLAGMAWLVAGILETTGTDASRLMTRRAVESEILSARIVALGLARDLDERQQELVEVAERISQDKHFEAVRAALVGPAITDEGGNRKVFQTLNAARLESDDRSKRLGLAPDFAWFVADSHGIEKWRNPFNRPDSKVPLVVGRSFAFRDYFHGRGQDYRPDAVPQNIEPIQTPYLSHRFEGAENGRYLVAITVPIWDANEEKVIAVLGRMIEIGSLLDEYGRAVSDETQPARRNKVTREIALIEQVNGTLLDHTWFDKNTVVLASHPISKAELDALRVPEELRANLQQLATAAEPRTRKEFDHDNHYVDPLAGLEVAKSDLSGEWLAAFAPVAGTDWVTVVQEQRSAALEPVQAMKSRLTHNGLWALLASCGLIGVLWYFVGRALNDRTPRLWPFRSARRGNGSIGTEMPSTKRT